MAFKDRLLIIRELGSHQRRMLVRLIPGVVSFLYLNATLLLFVFGPWPWPLGDGSVSFYLYVVVAYFLLLTGYLAGTKFPARRCRSLRKTYRLFYIGLLLNIALILPTSWARTGDLIPDVISGILSPGSAYANSQTFRSPYVEYIRIVASPLLAMSLPIGFFYWRILTIKIRLLVLMVLLGICALFISMGTNRDLFVYLILIPVLIVSSVYAGVLTLRKRTVSLMIVAAILASIGVFTFFGSGQTQRYGSGAGNGYFSGAAIHSENSYRYGSSDEFDVIRTSDALISYMTHGYYGAYLTMQEKFESLYGIGNSQFLMRKYAELTGDHSILTRSYLLKIETKWGWQNGNYWASIFPWIASDVGFGGALVAMFFIGLLFAMLWGDVLTGKNPFAVVLFSQLCILVLFIPANNQIFQSAESFLAFYILLGLWIITRKRPIKAAT